MSDLVVLKAGENDLFPYSLNKCDTASEFLRCQLAHDTQTLTLVVRELYGVIYRPNNRDHVKSGFASIVYDQVCAKVNGIRDRNMGEFYTVIGTRIRRRSDAG